MQLDLLASLHLVTSQEVEHLQAELLRRFLFPLEALLHPSHTSGDRGGGWHQWDGDNPHQEAELPKPELRPDMPFHTFLGSEDQCSSGLE